MSSSTTHSRAYRDDITFLAGRYPEHRGSADRLAAACRELRERDMLAELELRLWARITPGTPEYEATKAYREAVLKTLEGASK